MKENILTVNLIKSSSVSSYFKFNKINELIILKLTRNKKIK